VPEHNKEALYRQLLELNYLATEDGAFAIDRQTGRVYLRALRSLESLDFDEFVDLLDTIARVADEWDDKLRAQFGGM
jgi:Tir chaperone protein (CesT) family